MGTLSNSEDPDEMPHNAAFHLGLRCLLRMKMIFRERNTILFGNNNLCTTSSHPMLIVSYKMKEFSSIQRINSTTHSYNVDTGQFTYMYRYYFLASLSPFKKFQFSYFSQ